MLDKDYRAYWTFSLSKIVMNILGLKSFKMAIMNSNLTSITKKIVPTSINQAVTDVNPGGSAAQINTIRVFIWVKWWQEVLQKNKQSVSEGRAEGWGSITLISWGFFTLRGKSNTLLYCLLGKISKYKYLWAFFYDQVNDVWGNICCVIWQACRCIAIIFQTLYTDFDLGEGVFAD